jgi:hypothetical protein
MSTAFRSPGGLLRRFAEPGDDFVLGWDVLLPREPPHRQDIAEFDVPIGSGCRFPCWFSLCAK